MQKKAPYDSIALRLKNAGARDKTAKTSKKKKSPEPPPESGNPEPFPRARDGNRTRDPHLGKVVLHR